VVNKLNVESVYSTIKQYGVNYGISLFYLFSFAASHLLLFLRAFGSFYRQDLDLRQNTSWYDPSSSFFRSFLLPPPKKSFSPFSFFVVNQTTHTRTIEINQFCSSHSLQQVYIDDFDTLDEALARALQEDCNKWNTGITVISIRLVPPAFLSMHCLLTCIYPI